MRTRGWAGDPPADDDEARERIVEAAMRCIDRFGPTKTRLSDVARELGVTRQTVYRLFDSTEALFEAVAETAATGFFARLKARLVGMTDPAEMLVEALAYTIERLPSEPHIGQLLSSSTASYSRRITAANSFEFARAVVMAFDIDWKAVGFDDRDIDELVEVFLRLVQSFSLDEGRRRSRTGRREFLDRWAGDMVRARMAARYAGRHR